MTAETLALPDVIVTQPGVYDIPEDIYHSDPVPGRSLSSSGAKQLMPPSCPAKFRHEQLHGRPNKKTFDIGHAAHATVLGVGAPLAIVDADDWRTKAAKEQRDAAYAAGHTPILTAEHEQVEAMAVALREHPIAGALLAPERGLPEQSLFRKHPSGVWLRSRLDWLPHPTDGRMILADYKSTISAEPTSFAKSVWNYGYYQQAAWYLDMVVALELAETAAFVFVAQEKTEPYLVTVFELDYEALRVGRERNEQAIELYAECSATDTWPSYTSDVEMLSLPRWALS